MGRVLLGFAGTAPKDDEIERGFARDHDPGQREEKAPHGAPVSAAVGRTSGRRTGRRRSPHPQGEEHRCSHSSDGEPGQPSHPDGRDGRDQKNRAQGSPELAAHHPETHPEPEAAAGNPAAADRLWPWFEENVARIAQMHPLLFERVVAAFVPGPGLLDPDRTSAYTKALLQSHPRLKDVIALSLERLELNTGFQRRENQA